MSNRREILQMGIAATVLPLVDTAWAAPTKEGRVDKTVSLYQAIYDTRFDASRAFGERMAAHGVATAAMSGGDVTPLWYQTFGPQWQKGAVAIAGLTARGPLFCLEQLAWFHGMRVVFRAEHSTSSGGAVRHEVEGDAVVLDAVRRGAMDADWVSAVSDAVARYPQSGVANGSVQLDTVRPTWRVPEDEPLYSWVIAPVVRG